MAGPPSDDNIQGKTKLRSAWAQGSMEQNRLVPDRTRTSKNLKSRSGPDPAQKNFETWDRIRTEKIDKTLDRTGTEKNSQMSDRTRPGAPWIPKWD